MKRIVLIMAFFAGLGGVFNIYPLEVKDFQWESGAGIKIPIKHFFVQTTFRTNGEKNLWGGGFGGKITKKKIPLDFKAGNIGAAGSLSLLNNPQLSSVISPFSISQGTVTILSSRLPDGTSWNKPLSGFMKVSGLSALYTEEKLLGVCASCKWFQWTFVSSPLSAGKTESWYSERPFLKDDFRSASMMFQAAWKNEKLSFLFFDALYLQPDGKLLQVFRTENRIGPVSLSIFANPNHNLITASGKVMDEFYQIKGNIQGKSEGGKKMPVFWKYGFSFLGNLDPVKMEFNLKTSTGFRFLCYVTSLNGVLSGDISVPYEEDSISLPVLNKISLSLKNTWYFSVLQPLFRAGFSFIPLKNYSSFQTTENMALSINVASKPSLYMNITSELKQKNGIWQGGKSDLGLSLKYQHRLFDVSGKIGLSIEY